MMGFLADLWDWLKDVFGQSSANCGAVFVTNPDNRGDLGVVRVMADQLVKVAGRPLEPGVTYAKLDKKHRFKPKGTTVNTIYGFGIMRPDVAQEFMRKWTSEELRKHILGVIGEHKLLPPPGGLAVEVAWEVRALDEIADLIVDFLPELRELEVEQPLIVLIALETAGAVDGCPPALLKTSTKFAKKAVSAKKQDSSHTAVLYRAGKREMEVALKDETVVGRGSECDVQLDDPKVSRRHALIRANESITVEDQESHNGTRLGGKALSPKQPQPWKPGQAVEIGPFELRLPDGVDGLDTCDADEDTEDAAMDTEDAN